MNEFKPYQTSDWNQICWLIFNEVDVLSTMRVGHHQVKFGFDNPKQCDELVRFLTLRRGDDSKIFMKALESIRTARSILRQTP